MHPLLSVREHTIPALMPRPIATGIVDEVVAGADLAAGCVIDAMARGTLGGPPC